MAQVDHGRTSLTHASGGGEDAGGQPDTKMDSAAEIGKVNKMKRIGVKYSAQSVRGREL
ncbi:hypothetical protein GALL_233510 [mine drainage metagenome]|uniref:Uncharacterized protein n=1 Tax=mine drainage metagenome TaxID=410659 RepID=A0A1J5S2Y6_9ZZZZ